MRNALTTAYLAKGAAIALGIVGALIALYFSIAAAKTDSTASATWFLGFIGSLSASIAYFGVELARKTTREQNSLSFIKEYNDNARTDNVYRLLRKMRDENLAPPNFEDKENQDRKNFLALMNRLEALAIGIKYKIYDEKLIRKMFGDEIREIYQISKPLIALIHKEKPHSTEVFCEIKELAKRLDDAA